jgi:hypothetical protein
LQYEMSISNASTGEVMKKRFSQYSESISNYQLKFENNKYETLNST